MWRRKNKGPKVKIRDVVAKANTVEDKAIALIDSIAEQVDEAGELLDEPKELGGYLKEVAQGFVEAMREDLEREGSDADNRLILDAAIQLIGTLIRAR